ncbi:MAG: YibE/F family protein [Lachnospiraceae bacterium]|nr:YibE/F family protein [Lachnospiraceae bacterium]
MKLNLKKTAAGVIAFVVFVAALIYCNKIEKADLISTEGQSYEKAQVVEITKDNLAEDGNRYGEQKVILKINSGSLKGQEVEAVSPSGTLFGATCKVGMPVIAIVSVTENNSVVTVYSQDRSIAIYVFAVLFALIVCAIGGRQGAKAVISLAFTCISIFGLLFPLIYKGYSPVFVTILICVVATVFTMLMISGWSKKTLSAVIGTTCGVAAAGAAATIFGHFAGISGYNVPDIETLNYVAQYTPIRIGGLLFAGIIISSLGAVMDVGMSMSSAIQEIYEANPEVGKKKLFLSGIQVGRDMMGTMTNTLILAYVGGAITTLIINYAYNLSYNQLLNSYNIGIEIMQGLSGSLGVVLTVPITAAVAVELLYRNSMRK